VRVLITGSRDWPDAEAIADALDTRSDPVLHENSLRGTSPFIISYLTGRCTKGHEKEPGKRCQDCRREVYRVKAQDPEWRARRNERDRRSRARRLGAS